MVSSKKFIVCYTCWHLAFGFSSCILMSGQQAVGRVWNWWSSHLNTHLNYCFSIWIFSVPCPASFRCLNTPAHLIQMKRSLSVFCRGLMTTLSFQSGVLETEPSKISRAGDQDGETLAKSMESHKLFSFSFTYSLKRKMENAKRLMPNRKMKFKSLNGKD